MEHAAKDAILRYFVGRTDVLIWNHPTGFDELRRIRYGLVGSADLIGCWNGRFLAIEIKAPNGRQRDEQRAFQAAVERLGGLYVLARSVDDVKAAGL